jgi:hypothetical protein
VVRHYHNNDFEKNGTKTGVEKLDFLGKSRRYTKRFEEYILKLCSGYKAIQCERLLKEQGIISISDTTILRLRKMYQSR